MKDPDFIICGTAKAGTTALYDYLCQHPQIYPNRVKEPRYFSFRGRRPAYTGPGDEERYNASTVYERQRYYALFEGAPASLKAGEASPSYLYVEGSAAAIQEELPQAKLIFILRHPVERVFSAYLHQVRMGYEKLPFWDALKEEGHRKEMGWAPHWLYEEIGFIGRHVQAYVDLFPASQMLFLKYDEFRSDNKASLAKVCAFLGIDPAFEFKHRESNVGGAARSEMVRDLMMRDGVLKKIARTLLPFRVRRAIRTYIGKLNRRTVSLNDEMYARLTPLYREDVLLCQRLSGLDLSDWLKECR